MHKVFPAHKGDGAFDNAAPEHVYTNAESLELSPILTFALYERPSQDRPTASLCYDLWQRQKLSRFNKLICELVGVLAKSKSFFKIEKQ
jgi:hypothetical protein